VSDPTDLLRQPITVVGPGRAGTTVYRRLLERGLDAVLTRDGSTARAGIVLLAVPDRENARVARDLPAETWVGTLSGATPIAALGPRDRAFVVHPMQALVKERGAAQLDGVPASVTGAAPEALAVAVALAEALGLVPVSVAEEARPLPHLACVFASNYLVAPLHAAVRLLALSGFDVEDAPRLLGLLAHTTVHNVLAAPLEPPLTGPIARGDATTVGRHLEVLTEAAPELAEVYRLLGRATLSLVPADVADATASVLGDPARI
jgi:predicted short-subunit dehydrogenase-like oxidoreductase (DUF2520 family)